VLSNSFDDLKPGDGALGKSLFLQDYISKEKKNYELDQCSNLCVLTKTNARISHISFNADCEQKAETLVIQLWERSDQPKKVKPAVTPVNDRRAGQDSDKHPVHTPLWDKFLENLQLASDSAAGCDFIDFIQNHCISGDLLWKDSDGNWADHPIPLAVKMETLFNTVWCRRQAALDHVRRQGVDVNDDELELGDEDMKTLSPLWIPELRILIMRAMGWWRVHENGAWQEWKSRI
jgi:hypothetical protein